MCPALVEYAKDIPDVAYAQANLFSCSQDAQSQMAEVIKENKLNRVVVAACSPSTHQPIFQDMLRTAGLNKYLFEMANIRNQCTWVHQSEPEAATEKCKSLIRMGGGQGPPAAAPGIPLGAHQQDGPGGRRRPGRHDHAPWPWRTRASRSTWWNAQDRLGGNARKLHTTWRGGLVAPRLEAMIRRVTSHPNISMHFESIIEAVDGVVGNFTSTLSQSRGHPARHRGPGHRRPNLTGRRANTSINRTPMSCCPWTWMAKSWATPSGSSNAQAVAFIQCVGSRIPERPYCNKVCCAHSVENAIKLKVMDPEREVYILYRDMRTYGERELLYQKARELGVVFIRFRLADPPVVSEADGRLKITVLDQVLGRPVDLDGGPADPGHRHHSAQ